MIRWVYTGFSGLFLCILVFGALLLHGSLRGFTAHVVLSGSMEPALQKGSVVLSYAASQSSYQKGDIIVFTLPGDLTGKNQVVHRIMQRVKVAAGIEGVETKGDANTNGDPWVVPLGLINGKVSLVIPYIGYLFQYERDVTGYMVVVILTFFGIVIRELYFLRTGMRILISSFFSKSHKSYSR